jgi:hypothetical protein
LPDPETDNRPFESLTYRQVEALAGRAYADLYAARSENPGPVWDREKAVENHQRGGKRVAPGQHKLYAYWQDITEFLRAENRRLDEDSLRKFAVSYFQARGEAELRLLENAKGNYKTPEDAGRYAEPDRPTEDRSGRCLRTLCRRPEAETEDQEKVATGHRSADRASGSRRFTKADQA